MRPPRWLVMAPPREWERDPAQNVVRVPIRVRTWHPGFWLFVIREIWRRR